MKSSPFVQKALVILFWIGLWAAAANAISKPLLLPSPFSVFQRILSLVAEPAFWSITLTSLLRIMAGILGAILMGVLLAIVTKASKLLYQLLSPILTVVKVTPVASFIILALIWIGRDTVPAVISALMVLPVVWNNVSMGLGNIDPEWVELANVYQIPRLLRFKRITLPIVMPYFLSAIQTSIGIGWKAGIAAEVLTVPVLSIGKQIFESKLYMETTDLFAWTLVVILISLLIEQLIVRSIRNLGQQYNSEVLKND